MGDGLESDSDISFSEKENVAQSSVAAPSDIKDARIGIFGSRMAFGLLIGAFCLVLAVFIFPKVSDAVLAGAIDGSRSVIVSVQRSLGVFNERDIFSETPAAVLQSSQNGLFSTIRSSLISFFFPGTTSTSTFEHWIVRTPPPSTPKPPPVVVQAPKPVVGTSTTIIQPKTVITEIVERTVVTSGVSIADLQALRDYIEQQLALLRAQGSQNTTAVTNTYQALAVSNRIDRLDDSEFYTSRFISGTIESSTIKNSTLQNVSGSLDNITWVNATGTNATTTNLFSTNVQVSSFAITSLTGSDQCLSIDTNGLVTGTGIPCGSGGSGGGPFSTTTNSLAIRPVDTTDVLIIGGSATTTTGNILEVIGSSFFNGHTRLLTASSTALSSLDYLTVGRTASSTIQGGTTGTSTLQGFLSVLGTNSTSTFSHALEATYLNLTGTGATSTFANGISLSAGCITMPNGTCLGTGSGGITSIGPAGQLQTGSTITFATSSSAWNGLTASTTITGSSDTITFTNSLAGLLTAGGGGTGIASPTPA